MSDWQDTKPKVGKKTVMQTVARILALAAVADGHLGADEIRVLAKLSEDGDDSWELASHDVFHAEIQGYCADILRASHVPWNHVGPLDANTLEGLLSEIDDPALQAQLIDVCQALVQADGQMAQGEVVLLDAINKMWLTSPVGSV